MMIDACSWDKPGINKYTGSIVQAVERYSDISADQRAALFKAIAANKYERVLITKTGIISLNGNQYDATITDMHFGSGTVCKTVSRTKWKDYWVEPAKVYDVEGVSILVPDVCNNVSRITRTSIQLDPADVPLKVPDARIPREPPPRPSEPASGTNTVPEPGIFIFVLFAAILATKVKLWKKK